MLACIACSKQLDDGGDDSTARATTSGTKEPVKSLTSQIKDMVLKISGGNRQGKGGSSSSSYRSKSVHRGGRHPRYVDGSTSDSGQYPYLRSASSSSMPAWDFTSSTHNSDSEPRQRRQWIPGGGGVGFLQEDGDNDDDEEEEEDVVLEDNGEPKEWMAQVEPGVHITFVSLPGAGGGNDLKRIRFSREMFNKWQAQRWWGENYDRIMELYNVQRFSSQALPTPPRSEDGEAHVGLQRNSSYPRVGSARDSPITQVQTQTHHHLRSKERLFPNTTSSSSSSRQKTSLLCSPRGGGGTRSVPDPSESMLQHYFHPAAVAFGGGGSLVGGLSGMVKGEASSMEASRTTTSSRDEAASVSISNASDLEVTEWVEQDEPGVYITIRELPDGTRELRRVRFSREKFGEVRAKLWWEENRERIQAQYL